MITPEVVVEAYKKTGLKPLRFNVLQNNFACAMGAMYVCNHPDIDREKIEDDDVYDEYRKFFGSEKLMTAFRRGFDGCDFIIKELGPEELVLYRIGEKAAKLVFGGKNVS